MFQKLENLAYSELKNCGPLSVKEFIGEPYLAKTVFVVSTIVEASVLGNLSNSNKITILVHCNQVMTYSMV